MVLGLECLVLTMSVYLLRRGELALFSQIFLLVGQVYWMFNSIHPGQQTAWWPPVLLIAITVALSHWWQRQKAIPAQAEFTRLVQAVYALALMGLIYFWLAPEFKPATWMALTSGLAVCLTLYGLLTRAWWIAAFSQLFLFVSIGHFFLQFAGKPFPAAYALVPIGVTGLFSWATVSWFQRGKTAHAGVKESLTQLAMAYRWCALVMSLIWIYQHIPEVPPGLGAERRGSARFRLGWLPEKSGGIAFLGSVFRGSSGELLGTTGGGYGDPMAEPVFRNCLVAQQRIARRNSDGFRFEPTGHAILVAAAGISLWMFISRLVMERMSGFYLDRELVGFRSLPLRIWHPASGTRLSLAWLARARGSAGTRGDLRCLEARNGLSDS